MIDTITRVAPLGVRFWDPVTGTQIADGLVFTGARARVSPSGVYVLRDFPRMGAVERGTGDDAFWADPPAIGTFRIGVSDAAGRYLPICFDATIPARGVYASACAASVSPAATVPLFSSSARLAPPGMAVLRAQLSVRQPSFGPAAWAVLEVVSPDNTVSRGVADGHGTVTVLLPWPEPPGIGPVALPDQTWQIGLRVRFGTVPIAGPGRTPELCALLAQPKARLLADTAGTPLTTATLRYGRQLVLRTSGLSDLLVTADSTAVQGSNHA